MANVNLQVGANADDGRCHNDTTFNVNLVAFGADATPESFDCFARFTGVAIPQGATIVSAVLTFKARLARAGDTVRVKLSCNDADNATAPTDCASLIAKDRTTAQIDWDFTTDWVVDSEYESVDITTAVQEVINRGSWLSGNALMVLIDDDGSDASAARHPHDYNDDTAKAIKLAIVSKVTQSSSITADAIIFKVASSSFTADAIVLKTASSSFTADAIVRVVQSGSFTADAIVFRAVSSSITADAIVFKTASSSITADAIVLTVNAGSFTADAVIVKGFSADAIIRVVQSGSITADSIVKTVNASSFTADADIVKAFSADAIIRTVNEGSFTADAYIEWYSVYPGAYDDWADVANVDPLTSDSGTYMDKEWMTLVIQAIIEIQHAMGLDPQGSYSSVAARVEAIWAKMQTMGFGNFTADAIILKTVSSSITADAIVLVTQSGSITSNAIVLTVNASSFTADADIVKGFSADAIIRVVQSSSITADAIVQVTQSSSFDADAIIIKTIGGSFTADADIVE